MRSRRAGPARCRWSCNSSRLHREPGRASWRPAMPVSRRMTARNLCSTSIATPPAIKPAARVVEPATADIVRCAAPRSAADRRHHACTRRQESDVGSAGTWRPPIAGAGRRPAAVDAGHATRQTYPVIVLDTPPTEAPESAAVSRYCDGSVLVVAAGRTKQWEIENGEGAAGTSWAARRSAWSSTGNRACCRAGWAGAEMKSSTAISASLAGTRRAGRPFAERRSSSCWPGSIAVRDRRCRAGRSGADRGRRCRGSSRLVRRRAMPCCGGWKPRRGKLESAGVAAPPLASASLCDDDALGAIPARIDGAGNP